MSQEKKMSKNFFDMTDEEIMAMEEPTIESEQPEDEEVVEPSEEENVEQEEADEESEEEVEESSEEEGSDESTEEDGDQEEGDSEEKPEDSEEENPEESAPEPKKDLGKGVDYEAVYKRIMETPIRANGKDIKISSVDEVVSLIQMGANYTKKMADMKPYRKVLKTLQDHELLNENDISFLIDLKNKNPEAIAKLLSDAQLDPMDIDTDKASSYKTTVKTATDEDVVLSEVISELKSSDYFAPLSEVITKQWDERSRGAIYKAPEELKRIHDHMIEDAEGNSIFKYVSAEVERRRLLGLVNNNLSDYEAYISVGNDLYEQQRRQQATATTVKRVVKPASKPSNVVDPQLVKQQKRAAAPSPKGVAATKSDFNPLDMSDEEFEKLAQSYRY